MLLQVLFLSDGSIRSDLYQLQILLHDFLSFFHRCNFHSHLASFHGFGLGAVTSNNNDEEADLATGDTARENKKPSRRRKGVKRKTADSNTALNHEANRDNEETPQNQQSIKRYRPEFRCPVCRVDHPSLAPLRCHLVKHFYREMRALRPDIKRRCNECDVDLSAHYPAVRHAALKHGLLEEAVTSEIGARLKELAALHR